jgi:hypothetical protein
MLKLVVVGVIQGETISLLDSMELRFLGKRCRAMNDDAQDDVDK